MYDTDLRLWDILNVWHRSGVLRYSSRWHRLETLSFLALVTQTRDSEIFCTSDTDLRLWDIPHSWHSTEDLRFSPRDDADLKDWDIQQKETDLKTWDIQHGRHRSKDLRYSHMTHRYQGLRYSTLDTTLKLWDIQHERHRSQDLRYSAWQNTELSIRDIQHGRKINFDQESLYVWHRLETLWYSIRLTQIRSIEVFIT